MSIVPRSSATRRVLDAWPILEWLKGAPGVKDRVRRLLEEGEAGRLDLAMSMMNVGEVYYILAKRTGGDAAEDFLRDLRKTLPIRALPVPKTLVVEAARLKGAHPISYGDAFAVATAARTGAALVTGDPDLRRFVGSDIVEVEWIGA